MKLKICDSAFDIQSEKKLQELNGHKNAPRIDLLTYKNVTLTTSTESKEEEKEKSSSSQVVKKLADYGNTTPALSDLFELKQTKTNDDAKQEAPIQIRPYPRKVFFIIANEFCERFSFYGLRTILVLYLKNVLDFDDSRSTIIFHLFAALCYVMPVLGAILADSVWGKFKTILYLSIVYLFGEIILIISSIFWDRGQLSTALTFFGLIMIGLGTGGIKPCVPTFAADQFLPHEEKWRQSFFSLFYGAINIACLLGMFLAPMLKSIFQCVRRSDCYPIAFSVPGGLMLLALISFLIAKNRYILNPLPEQNIVIAFCKCIRVAVKRKLAGDSMIVLVDEPALGNGANSKLNSKIEHLKENNRKKCWLHLAADKFSEEDIQNFRSVLHAFLLLIPIPLFYCLHDQQGSLWTLQANRMDGRVFNTDFSFEPDQVIVANPMVVLLAIPILDMFIYPFLSRRNILVKPVKRMTVGGILTALAFVSSALIEFHMQSSLPLTKPNPSQSNLLLVNGLNKYSIVSPIISYDEKISTNRTKTGPIFDRLDPSSSYSIHLDASNITSYNNYQLNFKLNSSIESSNQNETGCSKRGPNLARELNIKSIPIESTKLLYVHENGNGKLSYYLFNESLQLPKAGKARIRLLYVTNEFNGVKTERFWLIRASEVTNDDELELNEAFRFVESETKAKLSISEYKEVGLPKKGDKFIVHFEDRSIKWLNDNTVLLKTGTRNLIIVQHDANKRTLKIHHELLQDNDYYVSILYQIVPYILISVAEVMVAVTGISCLYSIAPGTMKAVIFGAWYSTTALGNLLTVLLESTITFSNITNKFLFYAALMTFDSMLLSYIGSNF